jgi:hypothetical protein
LGGRDAGDAALVLPAGPAGDSVGRGRPARSLADVASAPPERRERRADEVLDLGEASRDAQLKRAVPVAVALAGAVVVGWTAMRRARRG